MEEVTAEGIRALVEEAKRLAIHPEDGFYTMNVNEACPVERGFVLAVNRWEQDKLKEGTKNLTPKWGWNPRGLELSFEDRYGLYFGLARVLRGFGYNVISDGTDRSADAVCHTLRLRNVTDSLEDLKHRMRMRRVVKRIRDAIVEGARSSPMEIGTSTSKANWYENYMRNTTFVLGTETIAWAVDDRDRYDRFAEACDRVDREKKRKIN